MSFQGPKLLGKFHGWLWSEILNVIKISIQYSELNKGVYVKLLFSEINVAENIINENGTCSEGTNRYLPEVNVSLIEIVYYTPTHYY